MAIYVLTADVPIK